MSKLFASSQEPKEGLQDDPPTMAVLFWTPWNLLFLAITALVSWIAPRLLPGKDNAATFEERAKALLDDITIGVVVTVLLAVVAYLFGSYLSAKRAAGILAKWHKEYNAKKTTLSARYLKNKRIELGKYSVPASELIVRLAHELGKGFGDDRMLSYYLRLEYRDRDLSNDEAKESADDLVGCLRSQSLVEFHRGRYRLNDDGEEVLGLLGSEHANLTPTSPSVS